MRPIATCMMPNFRILLAIYCFVFGFTTMLMLLFFFSLSYSQEKLSENSLRNLTQIINILITFRLLRIVPNVRVRYGKCWWFSLLVKSNFCFIGLLCLFSALIFRDGEKWDFHLIRVAPFAHASALPSAVADKRHLFWTVSSTRVVLVSSVNQQKILMGIIICCHGLQSSVDGCCGLKILRRYPKLSKYRLEMHLFCFYPPCRLFLLYLKHCWSCWRIWDLLLELLW